MTAPYWTDGTVTVHAGDCRTVLADMPEASVDAICTDPPYGLEFMGKEWDSFKPGGKRPGFGKPDGSKFRQNMGTPSWGATGNPTCRNCGGDKYRNGDRKCRCAAPDFGNPMAAQMRTYQAWCQQWAAECHRVLKPGGHLLAFGGTRTYHRMACAIEDAGFEIRDSIHWVYSQGFPKSKSHLKPAHEPVLVARKPLAGTVAGNVLTHGTGALNIDCCRTTAGQDYRDKCASVVGLDSDRNGDAYGAWTGVRVDSAHAAGRWPTNLVFTHSAACNDGPCAPGCPVAELDRQSGYSVRPSMDTTSVTKPRPAQTAKGGERERLGKVEHGDSGGASRYFPVFRYEAKAPAAERPRSEDGTAHVTVKPLSLVKWLVRLVTPPGGLVLDPFLGSGTTAEACLIEGFRCVGIELDEAHLPLIKARLSKPIQPSLGFEDAS